MHIIYRSFIIAESENTKMPCSNHGHGHLDGRAKPYFIQRAKPCTDSYITRCFVQIYIGPHIRNQWLNSQWYLIGCGSPISLRFPARQCCLNGWTHMLMVTQQFARNHTGHRHGSFEAESKCNNGGMMRRKNIEKIMKVLRIFNRPFLWSIRGREAGRAYGQLVPSLRQKIYAFGYE